VFLGSEISSQLYRCDPIPILDPPTTAATFRAVDSVKAMAMQVLANFIWVTAISRYRVHRPAYTFPRRLLVIIFLITVGAYLPMQAKSLLAVLY
jgi:hypothetical protein